MAEGGTWFAVMRCAMRCVMTRVLPLPAPARMSNGPSVEATASRCWGLSPKRKSTKNLFSHRGGVPERKLSAEDATLCCTLDICPRSEEHTSEIQSTCNLV